MINKKEYKAPLAEITEFECADIITISELSKSPTLESSGREYVSVGQSSWSTGFDQN